MFNRFLIHATTVTVRKFHFVCVFFQNSEKFSLELAYQYVKIWFIAQETCSDSVPRIFLYKVSAKKYTSYS